MISFKIIKLIEYLNKFQTEYLNNKTASFDNFIGEMKTYNVDDLNKALKSTFPNIIVFKKDKMKEFVFAYLDIKLELEEKVYPYIYIKDQLGINQKDNAQTKNTSPKNNKDESLIKSNEIVNKPQIEIVKENNIQDDSQPNPIEKVTQQTTILNNNEEIKETLEQVKQNSKTLTEACTALKECLKQFTTNVDETNKLFQVLLDKFQEINNEEK